MKTNRSLALVWLLLAGLTSPAQVMDLTPIDPADIPHWVCNYYSLQRPSLPPCPENWLTETNIVCYISPSLGSNVVLVGDQDINYAQREAEAQVLALAARAARGPLAPEEDSSLGGYSAGDLWVEPVSAASNLFAAILHGTTNGSTYLITSTETLNPPTGSLWKIEGSLEGGTNDAAPFALNIATRTNSLFLRAQPCDECATTALPLWWQWSYFGVTGVSPEDDYDGDGVSNLQEYLGGTDPNKIAFRTAFTNLSVSGSTAAGTITVLRGVPVQMALLLDSTNFATADWTNYSATVPLNLGSTEGAHDVWIGLKGRAPASIATWQGFQLTRDTTPPVI